MYVVTSVKPQPSHSWRSSAMVIFPVPPTLMARSRAAYAVTIARPCSARDAIFASLVSPGSPGYTHQVLRRVFLHGAALLGATSVLRCDSDATTRVGSVSRDAGG